MSLESVTTVLAEAADATKVVTDPSKIPGRATGMPTNLTPAVVPTFAGIATGTSVATSATPAIELVLNAIAVSRAKATGVMSLFFVLMFIVRFSPG